MSLEQLEHVEPQTSDSAYKSAAERSLACPHSTGCNLRSLALVLFTSATACTSQHAPAPSASAHPTSPASADTRPPPPARSVTAQTDLDDIDPFTVVARFDPAKWGPAGQLAKTEEGDPACAFNGAGTVWCVVVTAKAPARGLVVFKTDDRGKKWTPAPLVPNGYIRGSVEFWAAPRVYNPTCGDVTVSIKRGDNVWDGTWFKTYDGGLTWHIE